MLSTITKSLNFLSHSLLRYTNISPVIWKNLASQNFVKIEFDPYLDTLVFFSSVELVKVRETLLVWQFFI